MSRYSIQLRVRPDLYYGSLLGAGPAVGQALEHALLDVAIGELRPALEGGELLDIALRRPTHHQAVNEVIAALEGSGYSLIEAEVSEIVAKTVQGMVLGIFSGGTVGSRTKNPYLELLAMVVGGIAGGKAGSMIERVRARHHYRWFPATGWIVTDLPVEAAQQTAPQTTQDVIFPA